MVIGLVLSTMNLLEKMMEGKNNLNNYTFMRLMMYRRMKSFVFCVIFQREIHFYFFYYLFVKL